MSLDLEKPRREQLRWLILQTLDAARPLGANEGLILDAVRGAQPGVTPMLMRRELDYLRDRQLITLEERDGGIWFADLTRCGVDVVEYTVDCGPGIGRPPKYW